jgi:hypothetical protein
MGETGSRPVILQEEDFWAEIVKKYLPYFTGSVINMHCFRVMKEVGRRLSLIIK